MKKEKNEKEKFSDIIYDHTLVKRTLMVAAFPALIKGVYNGEETLYEGFLPGFEFAEVKDMATEDDCVEYLQDMLDDEVEELVLCEKSLPDVADDEDLLKEFPEYKIVYLDINVNALPEDDFKCTHNCATCSSHCEFQDKEIVKEDIDDCDDCCCDDDCDCDEHED